MARITWISAVQEYNARTGKKVKGKKGSPEYPEIRKIFEDLKEGKTARTSPAEAKQKKEAKKVKLSGGETIEIECEGGEIKVKEKKQPAPQPVTEEKKQEVKKKYEEDKKAFDERMAGKIIPILEKQATLQKKYERLAYQERLLEYEGGGDAKRYDEMDKLSDKIRKLGDKLKPILKEAGISKSPYSMFKEDYKSYKKFDVDELEMSERKANRIIEKKELAEKKRQQEKEEAEEENYGVLDIEKILLENDRERMKNMSVEEKMEFMRNKEKAISDRSRGIGRPQETQEEKDERRRKLGVPLESEKPKKEVKKREVKEKPKEQKTEKPEEKPRKKYKQQMDDLLKGCIQTWKDDPTINKKSSIKQKNEYMNDHLFCISSIIKYFKELSVDPENIEVSDYDKSKYPRLVELYYKIKNLIETDANGAYSKTSKTWKKNKDLYLKIIKMYEDEGKPGFPDIKQEEKKTEKPEEKTEKPEEQPAKDIQRKIEKLYRRGDVQDIKRLYQKGEITEQDLKLFIKDVKNDPTRKMFQTRETEKTSYLQSMINECPDKVKESMRTCLRKLKDNVKKRNIDKVNEEIKKFRDEFLSNKNTFMVHCWTLKYLKEKKCNDEIKKVLEEMKWIKNNGMKKGKQTIKKVKLEYIQDVINAIEGQEQKTEKPEEKMPPLEDDPARKPKEEKMPPLEDDPTRKPKKREVKKREVKEKPQPQTEKLEESRPPPMCEGEECETPPGKDKKSKFEKLYKMLCESEKVQEEDISFMGVQEKDIKKKFDKLYRMLAPEVNKDCQQDAEKKVELLKERAKERQRQFRRLYGY